MPANKTKALSGAGNCGRVLLYDVETSPNLAWIWGKYEQDALGDFIKERQIISVAWKWLGEKVTHVLALPSFPRYQTDPENNRELIRELHRLFVRADTVVGHNVDGFDDRMANTDFLVNGLPPPPPHRSIDTLKIARGKFRFNSNKLDDLGARLGLGRKKKTGGFALWRGCMLGDPKCWDTMMAYNKQDVDLLERVYLKLRPWTLRHPDMNAIDRHTGCPACRGVNVIRRGMAFTAHGRVPRFQCKDCGKWSKGQIIRGQVHYR